MKTCKKEHPYADMLRAIADGEEIQWSISTGDRQPKTININGYEVPTPLTTIPSNGEVVHFPDICKEYLYTSFEWVGTAYHFKLLQRGLLHKNFVAAIAHSIALMSFTEDLT